MEMLNRLPLPGTALSFLRPLVIDPDPRLHRVCEPIMEFNTEALYEQAGQMIHALWKHRGIGLAANQLGYDNQMIVVIPHPEARSPARQGYPMILCNPEIAALGKLKQTMTEGCLSFPGQRAIRTRAMHISIMYRTIDGGQATLAGKGLFGQCVQHELDHLNGRTFLEKDHL